MTWKVEKVPELTGYVVEWAAPGSYYLSRRNRLFHSTDLKPPFREIGAVAAPGWKQMAANFRLGQRLLRFMVNCVIPLANGDLFVSFDKTVGIMREGRWIALGGLERPCRVLRSGCAIDRKGDIYFGEYLANNERGPMRVYRYTPGADSLENAYVFEANSIKHIHGVYFDKYTEAMYCLTGDADPECRILRSFDGFETLETLGAGDESWRAVSILFDEDNLFYGTDAEFRGNQIYKVDRKSLERTVLGEVSGTVFYSRSLGSDLFFATTAENAPSQKENVAALWHVGSDGALSEIASFPKDMWHPTLFLFGFICFPYSHPENELYFHLVGVRGDNETYRLHRP